MIIDAHQHFWALERGDYGWLRPELTQLYRDFHPRDLEPLLSAHGVDGTVIVQAAPTEAETEYLLALASGWTQAKAVVGWVDLASRTAGRSLERLACHTALRGVRPMIQDEPDPGWMLQPAVERSLQAVCQCRLTFDALVRPRHLGALRLLVDRLPDLPVVIDHAGKPEIASGAYPFWARDIRALSERSQVMCKLSGLLTEVGTRTADADLAPYVDHLLECFGPSRLMWGSDWPVLYTASDYGVWLGQAKRLTGRVSPDEQAQIFGGTAAKFYGIEEGS